MAVHRQEVGEDFPARFSEKINGALHPHIAEKGYDWEITVSDVARDFWRFNGLIPPPHRSEAQRIWAANDQPSEWDNQS
jgi:hypothetical protein